MLSGTLLPGLKRLPYADGGDGLQMQKVAVNVLNKQ